jgi:hypothetical protein
VKRAKELKAALKLDPQREMAQAEASLLDSRKECKARLKSLPKLEPPPPPAGALSAAAPPPSQLDLAEQYLALVEKHPPPGGADALLSHAIFHLRRLCRTPLTEFDLLAELKACSSLAACAGVISRCRAYVDGAVAFKGRRKPPSYWRRQQRRGKLPS